MINTEDKKILFYEDPKRDYGYLSPLFTCSFLTKEHVNSFLTHDLHLSATAIANAPLREITHKDIKWNSLEHYMQAKKFAYNPKLFKTFLNPNIPVRAIRFQAEKWEADVDPDWESIKIDVMRHGLLAKFSQNENLYNALINTNPYTLYYINPNDLELGKSEDNKVGKNILGRLLIEIRNELIRDAEIIRKENTESDFRSFGERYNHRFLRK